jgi:hypothetical protein
MASSVSYSVISKKFQIFFSSILHSFPTDKGEATRGVVFADALSNSSRRLRGTSALENRKELFTLRLVPEHLTEIHTRDAFPLYLLCHHPHEIGQQLKYFILDLIYQNISTLT